MEEPIIFFYRTIKITSHDKILSFAIKHKGNLKSMPLANIKKPKNLANIQEKGNEQDRKIIASQ